MNIYTFDFERKSILKYTTKPVFNLANILRPFFRMFSFYFFIGSLAVFSSSK